MQQSYNYLAATGKLHYSMTNDYMFRMVLLRDIPAQKHQGQLSIY